MSVEFNEPSLMRNRSSGPRISRISKIVIRLGLAEDQRGVVKVLIIILVLAVLATVAVLATSSQTSEVPLPPSRTPGEI